MIELPNSAASLLAGAFVELLGRPLDGNLAFIRCLPPKIVRTLAADKSFTIPNWRVAVVVGADEECERCITADRAVAWREDKGPATLLLVDSIKAGSGMDGIYSAAREITEPDLFQEAKGQARDKLPKGCKGFADKALSKARRLSRYLTPWSEFQYLCRVVDEGKKALGFALPEIGLWPVDVEENGKLDEDDLDRSARLVERVLSAQSGRLAVDERVAALCLPPEEQEKGRDLSHWLRAMERLTPLEVLAELEKKSDFWLNRLHPGLFNQDQLQNIELVPWRAKTKKPLAWSGLNLTSDDRLEWRLNPLAQTQKEHARLEVRWKTFPDTLPRCAVEYHVEIRAGSEMLAEKNLSHSGRAPQKAIFVQDDFDELAENDRFDVQVVIRSLGDTPCKTESEDFILCYGNSEKESKGSTSTTYPTLAIAAAYLTADRDSFERLSVELSQGNNATKDKKGFITCHWENKSGRVFCPALLSELADNWIKRKGELGRWRQRVRADGSAVGDPEFIPIEFDSSLERLVEASQRFSVWMEKSQGPLGMLYGEEKVLLDYVNSALAAWENGAPNLTLIHTLEVISLAGNRLGLIVLPTHPLRVAWQQGFDLLVAHHRFEEGLPAHRIKELLKNVTGTHCPAFLPGLNAEECFVFADTLGHYAAVLVPIADPEPKATVALLSRLLLGEEENTAPSVSREAAKVLGEEVQRYLQLHPDYRCIKVHALRAGDAMPVARALGLALPNPNEETENEEQPADLCYHLDLYPAAGQPTELTGRFLSATAERRRSGAGAVPIGDRWLLESVDRPGGVTLPKLRWARRALLQPEVPAHLALTFDLFRSRVVCQLENTLPLDGLLEVHGLLLMPIREFQPGTRPYWRSFISPNPSGEKHPAARVLTERLIKIQNALLRATARHLGGKIGDWPVLLTEISENEDTLLKNLHRLCDWVITADRNAGMEYFDSPNDLPELYKAYIVDCVPERDDLGFLQLITSTSRFDEVVSLLDKILGEMGLSASPRNCEFLLDALKGISGRLALRLSGNGNAAQEMIALALAHSHCKSAEKDDEIWKPLSQGFWVPLDDVAELLDPEKSQTEANQRADLLYVKVPKRGDLQFTFIEVKFRRYLKTARSIDLIQGIDKQINASCQSFEKIFGANTKPLEKTVHRASLARILRFYASKGRRHGLDKDVFKNAMNEINRIVRERETIFPGPDELQRVGYVFCPEYRGRRPTKIGENIWMFGPDLLPESAHFIEQSNKLNENAAISEKNIESQETSLVSPLIESSSKEITQNKITGVLLGHQSIGSEVIWNPSTQGNPHLMIIGNSGMGKTNSLINLCLQLNAQEISPIIFSYHSDIDQHLIEYLLKSPPRLVRYADLGFNPLRVPEGKHYLDSVAMLRDLFSAIFPELGEVQLGRLRTALKQSYLDKGWDSANRGEIPAFRAFFELLEIEQKPEKNLIMRLSELDDYGLFSTNEGESSLLEENGTTLVQIHDIQNESLQRAFAILTLYNLYQNMFRRGPQSRITHAVIFDEAHKAAKLKLIPTMAKECRKYGISFVLASQEMKDFDPSLFTAVANYLTLRLDDTDARLMAKKFASSNHVKGYADRIKQLPKYHGMYYGEGLRSPLVVKLLDKWKIG